MAPVVQALRARAPASRHLVIHTGQHYDREMSEIFLEDLGLPDPDFLLDVGGGSHGAQTGRALERLEAVLRTERPDVVIVPGDVNSTLAAALAAVKLGIPIAHLEAGLRSFDRSMPEEINRLLVDQIAQWCFIHSPEAGANLRREGVSAERIAFVGNTMIDTLVRMRPRIDCSSIHDRLRLEPASYVLVTLHRPALVDGASFEPVLERLAHLSESLPVVFPMHPRARAQLPASFAPSEALRLVEPLGYIDFLALEAKARAVLTDSGGVQEETTFLRVPCFTLRANTERPITLTQGTNRLLGLDPETIDSIPQLLETPMLPLAAPAGWDGEASPRVADILLAELATGAAQRADDALREAVPARM
jgi:UDP-N-acetylglucosamine 2-epimerase (non-hydrolysing)